MATSAAFVAFTDLGTYTKSYKELVEKNDMNLAPSIVAALDKVDSTADASKRKALLDAAVAAVTKWDTDWTAQLKTVTDNDDKLNRSKFAVEVRKLKQALMADALEASQPRWWDKPLAGKKCQPEKLVHLPDDVGDLQDAIEAYIKAKGKSFENKVKIQPKCKISKKIDEPGKVLVLGNPRPAMYPNGKPIKGWSCAEILNDKVPGKKVLAASAKEWIEEDPIQSKRAKPEYFYADDAVLQELFVNEEAHCYSDTADNMFDMDTKDSGRILVSAYAAAMFNGKYSLRHAIIHELFHAYEGGKLSDNQDDLGWALDEGCVEYWVRDFVAQAPYAKWAKPDDAREPFSSFVSVVKDIIALCGEDSVFKLWFIREKKWVDAVKAAANALSEKLKKKDPTGMAKDLQFDKKAVEDFADVLKKAMADKSGDELPDGGTGTGTGAPGVKDEGADTEAADMSYDELNRVYRAATKKNVFDDYQMDPALGPGANGQDPAFAEFTQKSFKIPRSGWKAHFSVDAAVVGKAWNHAVLPTLKKLKVPDFKVFRQDPAKVAGAKVFEEDPVTKKPKLLGRDDLQRLDKGAQIVIYVPKDWETKAQAWFVEVEKELTRLGIKPGTMPKGDTPLGKKYCSVCYEGAGKAPANPFKNF